MKEYASGFISAICLAISSLLFIAANKSSLGDITVSSIKVVNKLEPGSITTYDMNGKITSYIGSQSNNGGDLIIYKEDGKEINIADALDDIIKKNKEFIHRLREHELRLISRENDIYEAKELIQENNDLIYRNFDILSADIDERIELFRKGFEDRESLFKKRGEKINFLKNHITDNTKMIVDNAQEVNYAFSSIIKNSKEISRVRESLTKRILSLYGPY